MHGNRVLLTGVHTGLGLALARACLDRGALVWGVSRRAPDALTGRPGWTFRSIDLADHSAIRPGVEALVAGADGLDLAILNAGIFGEIGELAHRSIDDLRAVMDVNVWANKVLLDTLFAIGRGPAQVVGISSGAARNGSGGWGPYSISKAALNLLLRTYGSERPGTHFAAVAPGIVDTPMTRAIRDDRVDDPRFAANRKVRRAFEEGSIRRPSAAAVALLDRLDEFREHPSGAFLDVRQLEEREAENNR